MKIIWKVYFWIFAFIVVSGYSATLAKKTAFYLYFDILLSIVGLVSLWCYAYEKRILRPNFWRLFFCLFLPWNVINMIYGPFYVDSELVGQSDQFYAKLIPAAISLPAYIALFLYAFRSKEIWNES